MELTLLRSCLCHNAGKLLHLRVVGHDEKFAEAAGGFTEGLLACWPLMLYS
jgi:hypothetical protein